MVRSRLRNETVKHQLGVVVNKREPRSYPHLAGLRDEGVSFEILLSFLLHSDILLASSSCNLGQRPRNMLAKAGEGDRAMKTKMVSSWRWWSELMTSLTAKTFVRWQAQVWKDQR